MERVDLERAVAVAHRAADRARQETMPRFRSVTVETKDDGSPVTEADRAAERVIRDELTASFPGVPLLGEEFGGSREASGLRWIIDPIDGTIAYSRGIPTYTTLIALVDGDEPILGLIDTPSLDERIVGWKDGGCWRNGERVRASERTDMSEALIAHGDGFCFERSGRLDALLRMSRAIPMFRGYTDAFGHALVLAGAVDAMVDLDLKPWDAAPTQILIAEAGGACHVVDETETSLGLVFGSPPLCDQLLEMLEG